LNSLTANFFFGGCEMFRQSKAVVLLLCLLFIASAGPILGHPAAKDNDGAKNEAERATAAASVLTAIMGVPESSIPDELMERAHGIIVIPHVVKGAFGFGGQWGRGLASQRREDGSWTAPAFIQITGGSFGLQIGVQATDLVLVFTDENGMKPMLKGKVQIGADISAAAGPVGRKAAVGTDVFLKTAIFTYSRSKGLFAGVSLDGSAITIDEEANRAAYGKEVTGDDILVRGSVHANGIVEPFMTALRSVSPKHVHVTRRT
jgi:lipid-binding SYLF domain-containing protein